MAGRSATWIRQEDGSHLLQQPAQVRERGQAPGAGPRGRARARSLAWRGTSAGAIGPIPWLQRAGSAVRAPCPLPVAVPQEPRQHWQAACPADESGCDRVLGAAACLQLRGWRNTAVLAAALGASLGVLAVTALAAIAASRHALQHYRHRRGWRRLDAAAGKAELHDAYV